MPFANRIAHARTLRLAGTGGWRGLLVLLALAPDARATPFDAGGDMEIRWDNTIALGTSYAPSERSSAASGYCALPPAANPPGAGIVGEYACRYAAGLESARLDWQSQIDVTNGSYGVHASARAWYDAIEDSAALARGGRADIAELGGKNIELFEAFLHGAADVAGDHALTFRLGRHSLTWGESVYFAGNGIAAAQSPIDTYVTDAAAYQSQATLLPVGQASFSLAITADATLEGYYQFEWRASRIDPEASYTAPNDALGFSAGHAIALAIPGHGDIVYSRLPDATPGVGGRFGLGLKWRVNDFDFGFYGLRYDAQTPTIYYYTSAPTGRPAYRLEYPEGIELYGASVAGPIGGATFGAEISARRNAPLVNGGVFVRPGALADNDRHPLYPLGDTLQAQFSWSYALSPGGWLPDGATWSGEIAANRLLAVTANPGMLTSGRTANAASFKSVFEPQFLQALPRVDITLPLSVGYSFVGFSEIDAAMNRGAGTVDIGMTATVDREWRGGVSFTHYLGATRNAPTPLGMPAAIQRLSDWDSLAVKVQRTF